MESIALHIELQYKSKTIYERALRKGLLIRPKQCSSCLTIPMRTIEGHHPDYSKPLEVIGCAINAIAGYMVWTGHPLLGLLYLQPKGRKQPTRRGLREGLSTDPEGSDMRTLCHSNPHCEQE